MFFQPRTKLREALGGPLPGQVFLCRTKVTSECCCYMRVRRRGRIQRLLSTMVVVIVQWLYIPMRSDIELY